MRRLVSHGSTAFFTSVNYDVSALRVGQNFYRTQNSAALICSVTRIYIYMKRAKTKRTMISRGIPKRKNLLAAAFAYKTVIIFCKAFCFHNNPICRHRILRIYQRQPPLIPLCRQAPLLHREPVRYQMILRPA